MITNLAIPQTRNYTTLRNLSFQKSTFSQSLMVTVSVSKLGRTDLIFVDPAVTINAAYYRDVLLAQQLLPCIRQISGDFFIVQQDSAPAHRARETVNVKHLHSSLQICGHRTALTSIQLTTKSGA